MINLRGSRFTDIMPENLTSQLETQAFAYALGRQIEKLCDYADGVHIYAAVASMPENILDVLAVELRTPAYNQSFHIEVKRALIEGTLTFYARMGTPAACNQIIETIFGAGYIEEWFDYEGDPHHFRAYVGNGGQINPMDIEEFWRVLKQVKRLSSWLDEINVEKQNITSTLHFGGTAASITTMSIPEVPDGMNWLGTLRAGGGMALVSVLPVPEAPGGMKCLHSLHVGGAAAILSTVPIPAQA